jgi:nuclear pore complex protein Nup98-Nup96
MSFGGGFGGFGQNNNNTATQSTGFGGFGASNNNNNTSGKIPFFNHQDGG